MNDLTPAIVGLPSMSQHDVERVSQLEDFLRQLDQVAIATAHHFHAGLYARTIRIPAKVVITGALIKIPTLLTLSGHATVLIGDESIDLQGYHVLPAQAGRKQVFLAHSDTDLTMIFATKATTVEEAEAEFTDETDLLLSRKQASNLTIKGD